ncbi:hypothetical protein QAD02_012068 [Eretmocerus hayati]|uniref:Uncharacterized protein n=1 Tax=Eretmocerus hayati TaxID=131215 RepID=A0ACC2NYP8_9HYME|nr:hypothetical protein QAD02_012068 [Eretmocerus hayati]
MSDKNESLPKDEKYINLKVADKNSHQAVQFKIKMSVSLNKLMKGYCDRMGLDIRQLRFLTPEGIRITDRHTAASLELVDGDIIEVYSGMDGGNTYMGLPISSTLILA